MKRRLACAALALGLATCANPAPVEAGVFDIFGFGARAIGMGGAAAATADDHTASFYNPANLTTRKTIHLGVSFSAWFHDLGIEQPDPGDTDLVAEGNPESPMGISFGVLFPLGGKIENRIALGLAVYLPVARALRLSALQPATPRWYRYHTLSDKLHVVARRRRRAARLALARGRIPGAGRARGRGRLRDRSHQSADHATRRAGPSWSTPSRRSPAISIVPTEFLRFGVSYRGPIQLEYAFPLRFDFGEALDLTVDIAGVDLYTPHTLTFGSAVMLAAADLLLALDVEVALWSFAPDPTIEVSLRGDGALVTELGLEEVLDISPGSEDDAGFVDTVTVRFGAEQQPLEWLLVRAGYFFPASLGRSADRLHKLLGLGCTRRFDRGFRDVPRPVGDR